MHDAASGFSWKRQGPRAVAVALLVVAATPLLWRGWIEVKVRVFRYTVAERLEQYGPAARARLLPRFSSAGVAYPPAFATLVGLKQARELRLYAGAEPETQRLVATWPFRAASGSLGPKLREGDWQVPEGVYAVESLNPNSRYHLALRVGYPNAFDRQMAQRDGRTNLGGDIMIHGGAASIGCLAMGDAVAEELFVLAADTGLERITVILAPVDLRTTSRPQPDDTGDSAVQPDWIAALDKAILGRLTQLAE